MVAMVAAFLDRSGLSPSVLRGCIGADPLGELAVEGSLPISLKTAYDSMACLIVWAKEHAPGMQTILVQGCPYHDAGGNAVRRSPMWLPRESSICARCANAVFR